MRLQRFLPLAILFSVIVSGPGAAEPADLLSVQSAWVRAVPASQTATAAYFTIRNDSDEDMVLTAVGSDAAASNEIHRMAMTDGGMTMEMVSELRVLAGQTVELKPGGLHLMLINLHRPLKSGGKVNLRLNFDGGVEKLIEAEVRRIPLPGTPKGSKGSMMKGHPAR